MLRRFPYFASMQRHDGYLAPRPDGFAVRDGTPDEWFRSLVTVYEVQVSHHVDEDRLLDYQELAWILDEDYVALDLIIVDRFGRETHFAWGAILGYEQHGAPDCVSLGHGLDRVA